MMSSSQSPDVIIVGGGVIGVAIAYFLGSEHRLRCLVLERDAIASGASGGAAGELGAVGRHKFSEPYTRFLLKGIEMHASYAPALLEESGIDYLLSDIPMLRPAFAEREAEELRSQMVWQREVGLEVDWLDAESVHRLGSWLAPNALGAAYSIEKQLEAYPFALALAQAAERHGVEFRTKEVTDITRMGDRVTGVIAGGEIFKAGAVVVANGPWIQHTGRWLGMELPVAPLRGQIVHLAIPSGNQMPVQAIFHETGYLLPKASGDLMVGTTQEEAGFDPYPTTEARDAIMEAVIRIAPRVAEVPLKNLTACLRPYSRDEQPIMGAVPGSQDLYVATGHAFKGITLALITGKCMAQIITRGTSETPVEEFSPARFAQ